MSRRNKSFLWGGLAALVFLISGISEGSSDGVLGGFVSAIFSFTFISCLILKNNFLGEMILTVFSWGFIRMPGVIFTLDLDGIIWLITVKLGFWIFTILLALFLGAIAVFIGFFISVFVYPYAIYKDVKYGEI